MRDMDENLPSSRERRRRAVSLQRLSLLTDFTARCYSSTRALAMDLCPCARLCVAQAGIVTKRLNGSSWVKLKFHGSSFLVSLASS